MNKGKINSIRWGARGNRLDPSFSFSKNRIGDLNRRVVFYVGDPALRLAFPKQSVRLTTLNGLPISGSGVVLKALSKVNMGGVVVDDAGNVLNDYNGVAEVKVFDKNLQRQTLGNDGTVSTGSSGEQRPSYSV